MRTIDARAHAIPGLFDIVAIGGSTSLYRARQAAEEGAVAVRVLDCEPDTETRLRFERLTRVLRALSRHPHVITMYGFGHTLGGSPYVLLELMEEGSLGEWVAMDGRLPCSEVLQVACKIAGALETAHRAGIVHGRVRPQSILVSPSGEPQLAGLDWAVLRHLHPSGAGTEPLVDDDVRALGAAMFTLLTASQPGELPLDAALERGEVPAPVCGLIERCLTDDPAARTTSAEEFAQAIQHVQQSLGLAATDLVIDDTLAHEARRALHEVMEPDDAETAESKPDPSPVLRQIDTAEEPAVEIERVPPEPARMIEQPQASRSASAAAQLEAPEPQAVEAQALVPAAAQLEAPEPQAVEPEREAAEALTVESELARTKVAEVVEPPLEASEPPIQSDPASAPALVRTRPSRLDGRRRRRAKVTMATVLAAMAGMLGVPLLDRQAPAEPPSLEGRSVVLERPVRSENVAYTGFRKVTDDTGRLSVIVPEQWTAVRSGPWRVDGKDVGVQLAVTVGQRSGEDPWTQNPWTQPGALFAASETLGADRSAQQLLDKLRIDEGQCTYTGRQLFDDNLYKGEIDSYIDCGETDARHEILAAASVDQSRMVVIRITRLDPRDERARDRIIETFEVNAP